MDKVSIVILNFRVKDRVMSCIDSILKSSYGNIEIIVVDNNSRDDLEKALLSQPNIRFIQTGANLGYTGGNNVGIKEALKGDAKYIFILNPDTTIKKNTIEVLVKVAQEIGDSVVGPKIYFEDSKKIWYAGGRLDLENVLGSHMGVDEVDQGQYEKQEETDYVTGAAMFVSREVFEKIGLFDEQYFLYYEDSDFCFRAKKAGFKVMYIPQAVVYHANAKSTGLGSFLQDYFITRNRMLFARKFLSLRTQFALFREALRNLDKPMRRKAFVDFWINNLEKGSFFK